jgi:hypothetical protein
MLSRIFDSIATRAISMALLILLSVCYNVEARCQTQAAPAIDPKELHGGIEIALRAVRAIALRVSNAADGEMSILGSDQIISSKPFPKDEKSEYIRDLGQAAQRLSEKLQRDFRIPSNHIYFLGLSELDEQIRDGLVIELRDKIGGEIMFLDVKGETELNIAGNIPRRYQLEGKLYDNRSISALIDISATNIKGGYQQLSLARGRAEYDYVTWNIPLKTPLRADAAKSPGLMMRKKFYLMGNIVWALAALLYPTDRQPYLTLSIEDINTFYYRAKTDPEALLNPDLSKIRDESARNEARKAREAIKAIYSPGTLAAGAEALKIAVTELKLADKRLIFARNSNLARLLSFVHLQVK